MKSGRLYKKTYKNCNISQEDNGKRADSSTEMDKFALFLVDNNDKSSIRIGIMHI